MNVSAACADILSSGVGVGADAITSLRAGNDGRIYSQAPEATRANLASTLHGAVVNYCIVLRNTLTTFKERYSAVLMASAKMLQIRIARGSVSDPCVVSGVRVLH